MHDHPVGAEFTSPETCAACGTPWRPGARFCPYCGFSAGAPPSPRRQETANVPSPERFDLDWRRLRYAGSLFGLLLLGSFIAGLVTSPGGDPWAQVYLQAADAVVILTFAWRSWGALRKLLSWPTLNARAWLEQVAVCLLLFAVLGVYFAALDRAGVPLLKMAAKFQRWHWPLWSVFALDSLAPAVFEEIAFRGVLQSSVESVLGQRSAWLIQGALFSILHLDPIIFVSHFMMGLAFGFLRLRSKSLYPGMLAHATWNALAIAQELHFL
jgi:membrane protease YdiL (CAAX protease family)